MELARRVHVFSGQSNQMECGMEATWYDNLDDAPEQLIAFVIAWYIKQL
jgi:hypothetical protein